MEVPTFMEHTTRGTPLGSIGGNKKKHCSVDFGLEILTERPTTTTTCHLPIIA
jgi:hypothetical protein